MMLQGLEYITSTYLDCTMHNRSMFPNPRDDGQLTERCVFRDNGRLLLPDPSPIAEPPQRGVFATVDGGRGIFSGPPEAELAHGVPAKVDGGRGTPAAVDAPPHNDLGVPGGKDPPTRVERGVPATVDDGSGTCAPV
jgi:hypothetical protein